MKLTLDISNAEFDGIVDVDAEVTPTIFLNFPSNIKGTYEFELINSIINIYDFKEQIINQGFCIEDDSLFVFGKMKVRIEGVKGADFKITEGDFLTGRKQYHTWPYTLNKGDIICKCGGNLSFLTDSYVSIIMVTENKPKITITFNTEETVPIDFMNSSSIENAHLNRTKYEHTSSQGKLFDFGFFQEYLGSGREVVKSE
ncbi:hypothetical protein [Paenibacillus sp. Leaf72]|uniref:hypothetical protein n=1 Tax=Paenibacillus sp. Leaf72 TaxID=1736234 RepID=UPI0006FE90AA|nr:hypothetical protein [Paenibacillus sp. Leaf72]KQO01103.1 hypothetical protein ASF12_14720 [Paenibacillus sp. Leaf72]